MEENNIDYILLDDYEIEIEHDGFPEREDMDNIELSFIHLIYMYVLGSPLHKHISKVTITKTGEHPDRDDNQDVPSYKQAFWEKYRLWLKKI